MCAYKYNKSDIYELYHKVLFETPRVYVEELSYESISQNKLYKNGEKFKINLPHCNEYEPVKKKQKYDTNIKNSKTSWTKILNSGKNSKKNGIKIEENDAQVNIIVDNKSTNSTNTKMKIVCDEPLKTIESTTSEMRIVNNYNISKLEDSNIGEYQETFELSNEISNTIEKDEKKMSVSNPITLITKNLVQIKYTSIIEIENLYQKYFSKSLKENIIIAANILRLIVFCNEQHIKRLKPVYRKHKFKNRCDMMTLFKHQSILEQKFKKYFTNTIPEFTNSEFEVGFQMLFMSVLSVHKRLVQSKLKKENNYKNQILFLWNTLKKNEFKNNKVFEMINSNSFSSDCINLINLIENSKQSNPDITNRLSLFFVSLVHTKSHFQFLIEAVGDNTHGDIVLLLKTAISQYCTKSQLIDYLDPHSSFNSKKNLNTKISILCSTTSEDSVTLISDKIQNGDFKGTEPTKASQQIHSISESPSNSLFNVSVKPTIRDIKSTLLYCCSEPEDGFICVDEKKNYIKKPNISLQ